MLGNEGQGLSPRQMALCDSFVYIPQYGAGTASLNVAVACSIVLHHFALWAGARQGLLWMLQHKHHTNNAQESSIHSCPALSGPPHWCRIAPIVHFRHQATHQIAATANAQQPAL